MAYRTQFNRALDRLWAAKISHLRGLVVPKPGRARGFSARVRNRHIDSIVELATQVILRERAWSEMQDLRHGSQRRAICGRGLEQRFQNLRKVVRQIAGRAMVYSFWRGKRCLYVGKGNTWHRIGRYDRSAYLREATHVSVFPTSRSFLPRYECLAVHAYSPRDNRVKPARTAWGKTCPICAAHDDIRRELRALA